jgi:N-acetylmuramoyl-L-alanine amidase
MVFDLNGPLAIATAELDTGADGTAAVLTLHLEAVSPQAFAARSGAPPSARFAFRPSAPPPPGDEPGRLRVVLDPGHGGIDPGAERDGLREADLMLTFARELREVLRGAGGFDVLMTRDEDVFVPLEARISFARAAEADVFVSLHADALPEDSGQATGATLYTLSAEASDLASARLAERHDGADLMAGIDLTGQGDEIALVLMDLARADTAPRSLRLAGHMAEAIRERAGGVNRRPLRSAAFSVLKSPDIPSVLVEIGFLSSAKDRERIASAEWRRKAALGIAAGLRLWAEEDRATTGTLRRTP